MYSYFIFQIFFLQFKLKKCFFFWFKVLFLVIALNLVIALKHLKPFGLQGGCWWCCFVHGDVCFFVCFCCFIYFFFLEDLFADEVWIESLLYCTSILLNKNACLTDDFYNRTQKWMQVTLFLRNDSEFEGEAVSGNNSQWTCYFGLYLFWDIVRVELKSLNPAVCWVKLNSWSYWFNKRWWGRAELLGRWRLNWEFVTCSCRPLSWKRVWNGWDK